MDSYLLDTYGADDVFPEAEANITSYKQAADTTVLHYSDSFLEKALVVSYYTTSQDWRKYLLTAYIPLFSMQRIPTGEHTIKQRHIAQGVIWYP